MVASSDVVCDVNCVKLHRAECCVTCLHSACMYFETVTDADNIL